MSAATAIGMVSASLRNLLIAEMRLDLTVEVTVLGPDEAGGDRRANLFLYRLEENAYLSNAEPRVLPGSPQRLLPPPLSLVLYYLLTAYAPNDALTGNATAHQILGEAMRVFHEFPVVPRDHLDDGLLDSREDLKIVGSPLDAEELGRIWSTFSRPFRPCVLYRVATVQLDVSPDRAGAAPARVRRAGVPSVQTGRGRPVVTDMVPGQGPAGTSLAFTGEHLEGWRAVVTFGGRVVVDGAEPADDTLTTTVPADVAAGLYDVRIDVGGLFRRTFAFEVTT